MYGKTLFFRVCKLRHIFYDQIVQIETAPSTHGSLRRQTSVNLIENCLSLLILNLHPDDPVLNISDGVDYHTAELETRVLEQTPSLRIASLSVCHLLLLLLFLLPSSQFDANSH